MAKKHPIEASILEATEIDGQGEDEKRQKYLARLAKAATKLTDKEWKKLPEETQEWANAAGVSVNDSEPIEDFPTAKAAKADDDEDEEPKPKAKAKKPAEDDDDEEPKPKAKKPKAEDDDEDEKPAKKPKADDEEAKEAPKRDGSVKAILRTVVRNPKWSMEKVGAKVKAGGADPSDSTLTTQYRNAHNVLAVLEELGLYTPEKTDDDEDGKPAKKAKKPAEDDDDEPKAKPKKKPVAEDEDDDEKPAKKPKKPVVDDDDEDDDD